MRFLLGILGIGFQATRLSTADAAKRGVTQLGTTRDEKKVKSGFHIKKTEPTPPSLTF
jgi:hypothetical protein